MNPKNLPAGNTPNQINAFIEIPAQSSIKYEIDEETGALFVDRFLHTAMFYPMNYGFIPSTLGDDGDPLDVLVLSAYPVVPGSVIKCTPIGVLMMEDEAGVDEKLIAVPVPKVDPLNGTYTDVSQLPDATKNLIRHFFESYKTLEPGKWVKITGWEGPEKAKEIIERGVAKNG